MIRLATLQDLPRLLDIYTTARAFMRAHGNLKQWNGAYPDEPTLRADIALQQLYVIEDGQTVHGCFALIDGVEPTYHAIEDGDWFSSRPYGTIHRIASDGTQRGMFHECASFASRRFDHLRVDTHADNYPMQGAVQKFGFRYQGVIHLEDGEPRMAYAWLKDNKSGDQ